MKKTVLFGLAALVSLALMPVAAAMFAWIYGG